MPILTHSIFKRRDVRLCLQTCSLPLITHTKYLIRQDRERCCLFPLLEDQLLTQVHPASCTCLQLLSRVLRTQVRKSNRATELRSRDGPSWHNKTQPRVVDRARSVASRTTPKFRRCSHRNPCGCQDKLDRFLMSTMTRRAGSTRKFTGATRRDFRR